MIRLRIATCRVLPEPDADAEPLAAALRDAGFDARLVAWDEPGADWDAPVPTIVRSTWNYALFLEEFLAWIDRVARAAPLWNPAKIVRRNVYKTYLRELAERGVPTVRTTIVPRAPTAGVTIAERVVVKPVVGAGSLDTRVFEPGDPDIDAHLARIFTRCDAMIQPYVASVDTYGERSLVWIDGELSHAIRKTPRFSGDAERTDGPFPISDDEREVALAALAPYAADILYGRVDLARDDAGRPMVMEMELVEPSLFLARHPPAAARYAAGLARRLAT